MWPSRVAAGWPVAGSHSRTVPSSPPLASSRPSGENATPLTPPVWPSRVAAGLAGGRVPQPHRPVVAAAGQQPAVRGERHAIDPAGVAFEGGGGLAGGRVPQPHRPVVAGAGQQPPVRGERHRRRPSRCGLRGWPAGWPVAGSHSRTVPSSPALASSRPSGENATAMTQPVWPSRVAAGLAGGRVPQPHRPAVAGAGQQAARPGRTPPRRPAGVAFQGGGGLAGGRVPQPHHPVAAAAGQQPARPGRTPRRRPSRRGLRGWRRAGRWPGPTAAPSRRRRRWPAAARPGRTPRASTLPVWPSRVAAGWPVAGSHSRTVPSSPPLASSRPSGENATL